MKIKERNDIFGVHLGNVIASGHIHPLATAKEVSENEFAPNLLGIYQANKELGSEKIKEYFQKISQYSTGVDERFKTCKRLINKFEQESQGIEFPTEITKIMLVAKKQFAFLPVDNPSDSKTESRYEKSTISLLDLGKEVSKNEKKLKKTFETIKNDPVLEKRKKKAESSKLKHHGTFPYTENRIAELNASHASVEPFGTFILTGSPRDKDGDIQSHFSDAIVAKDCRMWFTLNQTKKENCPKFWDPSVIGNLKTGWKVRLEKEEVVKKSGKAAIVCSTLVATKGQQTKTIEHFHYDGWEDHSEAPDDDLLLFCAKTACSYLEDTKAPLGVNCKGGVGRTGVLATVVVAMRHIQHELKSGKALEEITINIPDLVYTLRSERPGIVSHKPQFLQIYRVLNNYVQELRSEG